jgi:hypothetical protein
MSVIRIKKAHKKPYVILDTTALNDARLSFRAKGLHTYLMAKPDDWQVRIDQLEKLSPKEGREAIRLAIAELEACGYVTRQKIRGERGRLAGWDTTVYETPALATQQDQDADSPNEPIGLSDPPTTALPTSVPPTSVRPTSVPPTSVPPTSVPPKSAIPQLLSIDLKKGLKEPRIDSTPPLPPVGEETQEPPPQRSRPQRQYPPGFLAWWEAYPPSRRVSKPTCLKVWLTNGLEPRSAELVAKIERLLQTSWKNKEPHFVKTSLPYLNEGRYDDDLVPLPTIPAREDTGLSEIGYQNGLAAHDALEAYRRHHAGHRSELLGLPDRTHQDG